MNLRLKISLIGFVILASLASLLAPTNTRATGETYRWQDATGQVVTASGGGYGTGTSTFAYDSVVGQDAVFKTKLTGTCGSTPASTDLKLIVSLKDYNAGTAPTPAKLSYDHKFGTCQFDALAEDALIQGDLNTHTLAASTQTSCDQGSLSWLMCPLIGWLEKSISHISTNILTPMLRVNHLSPQNTPGLFTSWNNMRNAADAALVLLFIVVIVGQTMGVDSYSAKRMLPRLLVAGVLVQFSFLISGLIVDIGNVLGSGIATLLQGSVVSTSQAADAGNLIENAGVVAAAGVTAYLAAPMIIPILALMAFSVLAVFVTLGARFLVLSVLVAISPLAILAWVLPNTETYFKKWRQMFVRLVLMFPLIIGILSIAGQINDILAFGGDANSGVSHLTLAAIRPFIFIAAFAMIPATFKWAGGVMASIAGKVNTYASGFRKSYKDSQSYKDRQKQYQERILRPQRYLADVSFGTGTGLKSKAKRAGARGLLSATALIPGGQSTPIGVQRAYSSHLKDYSSELGDLQQATPGNVDTALAIAYETDPAKRREAERRLQNNAPSLSRYVRTEAGRMALIKQRAKFGLLNMDNMKSIIATNKWEYGLALQSAGPEIFPKKPVLMARYSEGERDDDGNIRRAGELQEGTLKAIVGGWTAQGIKGDVHQENFDIAAEEAESAAVMAEKLTGKTIEALFDPAARPTFMDANKRIAFSTMIARQKRLFNSGNGKEVRDAVAAHIDKSEQVVLDELAIRAEQDRLISTGLSKDAAKTAAKNRVADPTYTRDQKLAHVRTWMGL